MTESKWKSYVGVKLIQAQPMSDNEFRQTHGRPTVALDQEGYAVLYPDGYESWSPKEQFEMAYLALGEDPTRISPAVVDSIVAEVTATRIDPKTCLVKMEQITGFTQYATAACVTPENYDEEIGKKIASKEIKDRLWFAMGFVLQWARFGLKKVEKKI